MHAHIPAWGLWFFVPLFAIRVVFRLRRFLSYQALTVSHELCGSGLLVLGVIGTAVAAAEERSSVLSLSVGLAAGAAVGLWGLRLARFDKRADGVFFQPNPYLGTALSVLLLGRIGWRLLNGPANVDGWTPAEFVRNPSTMFLFGLFAAHYLIFAFGLLRRARRSHAGIRVGGAVRPDLHERAATTDTSEMPRDR
jgi:hypothetical protein